MAQEIIYLVIAVSFFAGLFHILAGAILFPFFVAYARFIALKFNVKLPAYVMRRAYLAATLCIVCGLFFVMRIFHILETGTDYSTNDFLLLDILVACNMYMLAFLAITLARETRRIEKEHNATADHSITSLF
jgi:hypothetical protein